MHDNAVTKIVNNSTSVFHLFRALSIPGLKPLKSKAEIANVLADVDKVDPEDQVISLIHF